MFIDLINSSKYVKKQAAQVLFEASKSVTNSSWTTIESAEKEVSECCNDGFIAIGYIKNDELIGWIGLRPMYGYITWELHPIMVKPEYQKQKVGTNLLIEIEKVAKEQNILNIILGTDDEFEKTSLSKIDLYASNIFYELENIKNYNYHPFEFYQKNGYKIIGVIPDANGPNKPDIIMGKRIK